MKLKPMNEETLNRLELVRFSLVIKHFEETGDNIFTQTIIETICQMTHAKITNVNYARAYVSRDGKATPVELGLLNEVHGVPYRTLCNLGKRSSATIKARLERYIKEEFQYPLILGIDATILLDVKLFLNGYRKLFNQAGYLTKGMSRL